MRNRLSKFIFLTVTILFFVSIWIEVSRAGDLPNLHKAGDVSQCSANDGEGCEAREAADEQLVMKRRKEFLEHISNARNIKVAKRKTAFTWEINWPAQQKYCRQLADEIFEKNNITFPTPIFKSTSGTIVQLKKFLDVATMPRRCTNLMSMISTSLSSRNPSLVIGEVEVEELGGYTFRVYGEGNSKSYEFVIEYTMPGAEGRIDVNRKRESLMPESAIAVQGFSIDTRIEGSSKNVQIAELKPEPCDSEQPFMAFGYPANRTDVQKVVLVQVGGRILALEYGIVDLLADLTLSI